MPIYIYESIAKSPATSSSSSTWRTSRSRRTRRRACRCGASFEVASAQGPAASPAAAPAAAVAPARAAAGDGGERRHAVRSRRL